MPICRKCRETKSTVEFPASPPRRRICRACYNTQVRTRKRQDWSAYLTYCRTRQHEYRHNPKNVAHLILQDARRSDRKRGLQTDIVLEDVERLIKDGCQYCNETKLRMTLDRIDNALGHVKTNLVGCCIRCNYLRRDVPYIAWLELVPAVRSAAEKGLFGTWTGRCR